MERAGRERSHGQTKGGKKGIERAGEGAGVEQRSRRLKGIGMNDGSGLGQ
jgi:hypothetical protein